MIHLFISVNWFFGKISRRKKVVILLCQLVLLWPPDVKILKINNSWIPISLCGEKKRGKQQVWRLQMWYDSECVLFCLIARSSQNYILNSWAQRADHLGYLLAVTPMSYLYYWRRWLRTLNYSCVIYSVLT